jgi:hypothetical protein
MLIIFDSFGEGLNGVLSEELFCMPILVKNVMHIWDVNGILITPKKRDEKVYARWDTSTRLVAGRQV